MPVFLPTSQVSVQLTGTSSVPNNFTVDIYRWDVTTDAAVYDRTIVTGKMTMKKGSSFGKNVHR